MTNTVLFKNAHLLDPQHHELLEGRDILVEEGVVREVSDKPLHSKTARVIDVKGKTVMPGLIDLHVHVIAVELNLARQVHMPNVLITLRSVPMLRGMLRRGFTTVRDAGGAGFAFKQAVDSGLAQGPRLFVAGRALSQTGGHGDMRARTDFLDPNAPCPTCVRVGALARVVVEHLAQVVGIAPDVGQAALHHLLHTRRIGDRLAPAHRVGLSHVGVDALGLALRTVMHQHGEQPVADGGRQRRIDRVEGRLRLLRIGMGACHGRE